MLKTKPLLIALFMVFILVFSVSCLISKEEWEDANGSSDSHSEVVSDNSGENDAGNSTNDYEDDSGEVKFTVTFLDGEETVGAQEVADGEKAIEPIGPSRQDSNSYEYNFVGWFNGDDEWDFENDTVSENLTLVAKWQVTEFTKPKLPSED